MRNNLATAFLFISVFFSGLKAESAPPPVTRDCYVHVACRDQWVEYTYELLRALVPEMNVRSEIEVDIRLTEYAELGVFVPDIGCVKLALTMGFLGLVQNETEYLLPLAHELGHLKFSHKFTSRRISYDKLSLTKLLRKLLGEKLDGPYLSKNGEFFVENDFALMETQELEADEFASRTLHALGAEPCASQMFERFMNLKGLAIEKPGPGKDIVLKRIRKMNERCGR
jgi:hypothetical protein